MRNADYNIPDGTISTRAKWVALLVILLMVAVAAYLFGHYTNQPTPEDVSPQAAQSLPSGAVVLERKPTRTPAKPKKPGTKVEREIGVTVQPDQAGCDPVTVDLQLVREGDGRRVIASSPDGKVIAGLDVPTDPAGFPASRPWAAGMSCDPGKCQQTAGVWIERDLGRVRLGVEAARQQDGAVQARAKIGWVW
jgi:hypothetical protein